MCALEKCIPSEKCSLLLFFLSFVHLCDNKRNGKVFLSIFIFARSLVETLNATREPIKIYLMEGKRNVSMGRYWGWWEEEQKKLFALNIVSYFIVLVWYVCVRRLMMKNCFLWLLLEWQICDGRSGNSLHLHHKNLSFS